ncbi:hypothetical protein FACS1894120_2090 [Clostridia bacterium]|nr:hypothetical protein FACS1894120_2090 [Clostridia bacterium]
MNVTLNVADVSAKLMTLFDSNQVNLDYGNGYALIKPVVSDSGDFSVKYKPNNRDYADRLFGMLADYNDGHGVDRFMADKQKEKELENANDRRLRAGFMCSDTRAFINFYKAAEAKNIMGNETIPKLQNTMSL